MSYSLNKFDQTLVNLSLFKVWVIDHLKSSKTKITEMYLQLLKSNLKNKTYILEERHFVNFLYHIKTYIIKQ